MSSKNCWVVTKASERIIFSYKDHSCNKGLLVLLLFFMLLSFRIWKWSKTVNFLYLTLSHSPEESQVGKEDKKNIFLLQKNDNSFLFLVKYWTVSHLQDFKIKSEGGTSSFLLNFSLSTDACLISDSLTIIIIIIILINWEKLQHYVLKSTGCQ